MSPFKPDRESFGLGIIGVACMALLAAVGALIYSWDFVQHSARTAGQVESQAAPVSATDLAVLIRQHCRSRGMTIEQFEDVSGWYVVKSLDDPERFLHGDYSIDGIQDICRELGVDWQRFILSL